MGNNTRPDSMERITTKELADAFIAEQVAEIQAQVGGRKVLLALSGGVDSSVVAALLIKAIGKQLVCVHVNHGLLRKGEPEQVVEVFRDQMDANLIYVDAVDRFLDKLADVAEPEKKRKIIGAEFIRVFEEEARKQEGIEFLAQGTIYPDIIESDGVKAHHNVGGLPEDLKFELVEPLKQLFKDEVRACGVELGLPSSMVYRQPFPGPGAHSAGLVLAAPAGHGGNGNPGADLPVLGQEPLAGGNENPMVRLQERACHLADLITVTHRGLTHLLHKVYLVGVLHPCGHNLYGMHIPEQTLPQYHMFHLRSLLQSLGYPGRTVQHRLGIQGRSASAHTPGALKNADSHP